MILWLLSQVGDLSWDKLTGVTAGGVLAIVVWLFVSNRITTREEADHRADEWKELYRQAMDRLEKAEQRLFDSLSMASRGAEIAAKAVEKVRSEK